MTCRAELWTILPLNSELAEIGGRLFQLSHPWVEANASYQEVGASRQAFRFQVTPGPGAGP